jgi:porphobilinogen deaminase
MINFTKLIAMSALLAAAASAEPRPVEIIAATLIFEAGGERDTHAMHAVNEVIHNRSVSRHISSDRVCLQRLQFSCWNDISVDAGIAKAKKHSNSTVQGFALEIENGSSPWDYEPDDD